MTYNVFGGTLNLTQSINQSYKFADCQSADGAADQPAVGTPSKKKDRQRTSVGVQTEPEDITDNAHQSHYHHHHHYQQQQQQEDNKLISMVEELQGQLTQLQLSKDVLRNEHDLVTHTSVNSQFTLLFMMLFRALQLC